MTHIDFDQQLYQLLFRVEKPGRYTGGEYGSIVKNESALKVCLSYPDLYEIGMSNISVRRLYMMMNSLEGVACERVFAPAPDFEAVLRENRLPLFSLETRRVLQSFDIMGFSLGYELLFTNLINILDLGNIPPLASDRSDDDPIVLIGGTSATNPHPYEKFVDCAFIGEAEDFVLNVFPELAQKKEQGGRKSDLLAILSRNESVWVPGNNERHVKKSVWQGFSDSIAPPLLPVPNIKPVHDHGSVEIMRGCPNGCRFCHSGIYYRPFRLKKPSLIAKEVDNLVFGCGYKKISLLSLSSGDYKGIDSLVTFLSQRYKDAGVSFSLPSLRIESMTLTLLGDIAEVRKSGLTFAVETPDEIWQAGINKKISKEKIIEILTEAKNQGFRGAKFYFMIGLPVYDADESDRIIDYLLEIKNRTGVKININVATFVPKPHTPFERAGQLDEELALSRIMHLKHELGRLGIKVNYHSPFASYLEGMIGRGDKKAGDIVFSAYKKGARLDAWDEFLSRDIWKQALSETEWDVRSETSRPKEKDEKLVWQDINLGVEASYLAGECDKSLEGKYTDSCMEGCPAPCGACTDESYTVNAVPEDPALLSSGTRSISCDFSKRTKLIFAFSKKGRAAFLSHLNIMTIFEESFLRAGYFSAFTQGFNPHPVMEFASPLPLGMEAHEDIVSIELHNFDSELVFMDSMNKALPDGLIVRKLKVLKPYVTGEKKKSLASLYWGSDYFITDIKENGTEHVGLFSALNTKVIAENGMKRAGFPVDSFFLINSGIYIRFKKIEKKESTIQAFMKGITGHDLHELGYRITRIKCLASDAKGEAESFFDVCE
jgi:radical SAM-linked protein